MVFRTKYIACGKYLRFVVKTDSMLTLYGKIVLMKNQSFSRLFPHTFISILSCFQTLLPCLQCSFLLSLSCNYTTKLETYIDLVLFIHTLGLLSHVISTTSTCISCFWFVFFLGSLLSPFGIYIGLFPLSHLKCSTPLPQGWSQHI